MDVCLASFDPVPAPKGASAHILRNHAILTGAGHQVSLLTLGDRPLQGLRHRVIQPSGETWLHRARDFGERIRPVLEANRFDVVHVRSPFEGLSVPPESKLVYEVNAVYSIELPCKYPALASHEGFRTRMRAAELLLLERADAVVTPSTVTARYLADLGVDDVVHVPNCPSIPKMERTFTSGEPARLVYIGTLSPWQGLHQGLRCLSRLKHLDWRLTLLAHGRDRWVRKLLRKLEIADRVEIRPPLPPRELGAFLHTCDVGLAPLTPGERNLVQGCMPVKLLDYARAGLAVVAPDLQVVSDVLPAANPLYRAWSRTSMTELLGHLITTDRAPIARALRAHIERFDEPTQARALLDTYRSL